MTRPNQYVQQDASGLTAELHHWKHLVEEPRVELDWLETSPMAAAHRIAVKTLHLAFEEAASRVGVKALTRAPIWFLTPSMDRTQDVQKEAWPDLVFTEARDVSRITAREVRLLLEVVNVHHRWHMKRDTVFFKSIYEYNEVQEFALYFPDPEDERVLTLWSWNPQTRQHVCQELGPSGPLHSLAIKGLAFHPIPHREWMPGVKMCVSFGGLRLNDHEAIAQGVSDEMRRTKDKQTMRQADETVANDIRHLEDMENLLKRLADM